MTIEEFTNKVILNDIKPLSSNEEWTLNPKLNPYYGIRESYYQLGKVLSY